MTAPSSAAPLRRQLIGRVVATTSMVLVALLIPMAALIARFAEEDALAAAGLEVQATESVVAFRDRPDLVTFIEGLNDNTDGRRTTVLFADGDAIGPDRTITGDVVQARESGRASSSSTPGGLEVLAPVSVPSDAGEHPTGVTGQEVTVIRVVVTRSELMSEVLLSWAILGALGVALLLLAVGFAELLARDLLRSTEGLAATAGRLEAGDLDARVTPSGPAEIREAGHALNRLATRIGELLAAEREAAADLSHRLRTPLMALRLEVDELDNPAQQARVQEGVLALTRAVDDVIAEARRPVREGIGAVCDAAALVRARTAFWGVLAEDQGRVTRIRTPDKGIPVKAPKGDLEAAIDILLENVFAHTAEGIGFTVTLQEMPGGGAVLVVADDGGGPQVMAAARGRSRSSTGLGLDIARRTAHASGGSLTTSVRQGRTVVRMELGPPD